MYGGKSSPIKYLIYIVGFLFLIFAIKYFMDKSKIVPEEPTSKKDVSGPKQDAPIPRQDAPVIPTSKQDAPKQDAPVMTAPKQDAPVMTAPKQDAKVPQLLAPKNQQEFNSDDEYKKYQEKLEKQKRDMLSYQICGINNIPKCRNNFISV